MSPHEDTTPHGEARTFSVSFDYLCPFARNANEHVVAGLEAGAPWDVTFIPFSLAQVHVEDDDTAVWDRADPDAESGVLALQVGLAVRDHWPQRFPVAHRALFAARHDDGADIGDVDVLRGALGQVGLDADRVLEVVRSGEPLETLHKEYDAAVAQHDMWGVPTFCAGDRAVFVRLMHRPDGPDDAVRTVGRVLDLVTGFTELNEFKQTDIPR